MKPTFFLALLATSAPWLAVAAAAGGTVTGSVVDPTGSRPVANASVALQPIAPAPSSPAAPATTTDAQGRFVFDSVAPGAYAVVYSSGTGTDNARETVRLTVDTQHRTIDMGALRLRGDAPLQMDKVEVAARQEPFYNAIDRKIYNVGRDVHSATGVASDLLQNIPSVQVDVEGNVSLRGDSGVQIFINGKPSVLMGRNRAAVLEQMPADNIERIEVITNPSARYKPDGTGGIINLVLKRERTLGHAGSVRVNLGNDDRYNAGINASYNPGPYTLFGRFSVRQDDRERFGREERTRLDTAGNVISSTQQQSTDESRPFSRFAQIGADYKFGEETKLGVFLDYDDRKSVGRGSRLEVSRDAAGAITRDYERLRTGPDTENEFEIELTFKHIFAGDRDHELTAELSHGRSTEDEDDHFANIYRTPGILPTFDATLRTNIETDTVLSVDYVRPLARDAKLELGYELEREKSDSDFRASFLDAASDRWVVDPKATNRFVHDSTIHALYATYGRPIGKFGLLAGLRYEHAFVESNQMTAGLVHRNDYGRFYPSLHLNYRLADAHQLQLSYSHRVNRPDGDDLNPFPEYDDPSNLRAGNPDLEPEDTHAIEAGYQYERNATTYLASVYFRQEYNGITNVTRYIDATTLLTTPENLSTSRSAGLELGATTRLLDRVALNFSANVYRREINAGNLGFDSRRAALAWDAKLNANWDATDRLLLQLSTSYRARRLTAQGERHPSQITNLGMRYDFRNRRTSLVLTVSDLFNSLRDRTTLDTPTLQGEITRRRSSRIVYVGFVYNFGRPAKKDREDIQFDDTL